MEPADNLAACELALGQVNVLRCWTPQFRSERFTQSCEGTDTQL
jgi:hypothetical protein